MLAACNPGTDTVRIVVADDHPAFVDGLARTLPELCAVEIVARCSDGRAAFDAILEHEPDIALLDLRMPGLSGRAVIQEVTRRKLRTQTVVCSAQTEAPIVHALLEEGARGYITKTSSWGDICSAVQTVAAGGVWVSPELQAGLHDQLATPQRPPSERELEVLSRAAEGLTDAQIAGRMYISRETVRTNLKRCSEKLGVSGRTALVAKALRQGLLE